MPFYLNPGDSTKMDCILVGYYYVPSSDTLDTMYVYSNSINGRESIRVKINYYDDDYGEGTITGLVTDGSSPIADAGIYFFYRGNYIIHTARTDQSGFYSVNLPPGWYKIAAEKDLYYTTFFGQQPDPFNAESVVLEDDSSKTANITLLSESNTGNSISGIIFDSLSITPLRKGIVVVRRGRHSPTKIISSPISVMNGTYSAIVKEDGSYSINNIMESDYYFVQSFSDYFVPSYYTSANTAQVFWQNADSVYIDSDLDSMNIDMPRDSSLGGGNASGIVNITAGADSSTDVIIYAQSAGDNSSIFNYTFPNQEGSFNVPFLPYGSYRLVAQKIRYYDGYSSVFTIDSQNTSIGNLNITLSPNFVDDPFIPDDHVLLYNYPNPFNPSTTIEFYLPFSSNIELKIFDMLGEEIKVLLKDHLFPGTHNIRFDAAGLSSGVYLAVLKTQKGINVEKIVLLK
jgi:hypothetical protein